MSFGHAAYLGIGGYAVGMLAFEHVYSGFVQWPVALAASALFALVIGALSLRTRGVYFIMITLAFAQMAYYVIAGIARYGGDDGLTIYKRSQFFWPIDLNDKTQFYYVCLALLCGTIYLVWRLVNSRFGMVIQGARSNETRMRAIGFPTYRYKLICFVIAGTLCGLAGALLANQADFVSPAMMYWTRSGDLIIMVVLGGMGSPVGRAVRRGGAAGAGGGALRHHRILADHPRAAAAAGGAVRARRHRRLLMRVHGRIVGRKGCAHERPCCRSTTSPSASAASSPPTISCSTLRRRTARGDRAERRRQDHADRAAFRPAAAGLRPHPLRRHRHHRAAGVSAQRARARALVPDHLACFSISACSTMWRWRCRRMTGTRSASGAMPAWKRSCASVARAALERVGLGRARRLAGLRAQPRRAPSA